MTSPQFWIGWICEQLLSREYEDSMLFYGHPEQTTEVLQGIYSTMKKSERFRCTYHHASKIKRLMDFYEPILRLKYGDKYENIIEEEHIRKIRDRNNPRELLVLTQFCAQEPRATEPQHRKMPLLLIEGIEELFFEREYGYLSEEEKQKLVNQRDLFEGTRSLGLGNSLRAYLHQSKRGIIFGTVKDENSIQYRITFGDYSYAFFQGNFRLINVNEPGL